MSGVLIILTKDYIGIFRYLMLLRSVFLLQVEAVCAKLLVDTDYVLGFVLCNLGSDVQLPLKYCLNVLGGE